MARSGFLQAAVRTALYTCVLLPALWGFCCGLANSYLHDQSPVIVTAVGMAFLSVVIASWITVPVWTATLFLLVALGAREVQVKTWLLVPYNFGLLLAMGAMAGDAYFTAPVRLAIAVIGAILLAPLGRRLFRIAPAPLRAEAVA